MAFLDVMAQLRQARSELADHNIRVAEADENGDWNTKDDLREADYEYAAAVVEELDTLVDLLDSASTWPAWRGSLAAALAHAESMPDDAAPVSLAHVLEGVDTARTAGETDWSNSAGTSSTCLPTPPMLRTEMASMCDCRIITEHP